MAVTTRPRVTVAATKFKERMLRRSYEKQKPKTKTKSNLPATSLVVDIIESITYLERPLPPMAIPAPTRRFRNDVQLPFIANQHAPSASLLEDAQTLAAPTRRQLRMSNLPKLKTQLSPQHSTLRPSFVSDTSLVASPASPTSIYSPSESRHQRTRSSSLGSIPSTVASTPTTLLPHEIKANRSRPASVDLSNIPILPLPALCDPNLPAVTIADLSALWTHNSLLFHLHSFDEALRDFKLLLRRPGIPWPLQTRLLLNIGIVHTHMDAHQDALDAFYAAVELNAQGSIPCQAINALGLFLLGTAAFHLGQTERSRGFFDMALEVFGDEQKEFDMTELGLNFTMRKRRVEANLAECKAKVLVDRKDQEVNMRSRVSCNVVGLPSNLMFEEPVAARGAVRATKRSSVEDDWNWLTSKKPQARSSQQNRFLIRLGDLRLNKPLPPLPLWAQQTSTRR